MFSFEKHRRARMMKFTAAPIGSYVSRLMAIDESTSPRRSVTYAETVAAFIGDRTIATRHWPTTHTLFCDETGNSGSKFYAPDQPVYAEGGWLVAHADRAQLEATILEIEQQFRFTPKTKGTRLKDSAPGRAYFATVLATVSRAATPFFYLVEKKYFI
jgi:hypothetical protein